jgi:hypothetical protein
MQQYTNGNLTVLNKKIIETNTTVFMSQESLQMYQHKK